MAENLIDQIKRHEGFRSHVYLCSAGKQTIGYGYNLDAGMTQEEADQLLRSKLARVRDELDARLPWFSAAPSAVRDVLLNMAYQMGVHGLLGFRRTLTHLRAGRYRDAADEMLESRWAHQTPARARELAGIVRAMALVSERD